MAQTAEEVFARDTAKMAARDCYRMFRKTDSDTEFIRIMVKSMILDILEDEDVVMNVFTDEERETLEGALIIRS